MDLRLRGREFGATRRRRQGGIIRTFAGLPGMDTGWDAVNMDRVRRLLRGEPLPALPPEAYRARGERV